MHSSKNWLKIGIFGVKKADNDVLNGIWRTSTLMKADCLRVHEKCADFLREIKLYRWDEKYGILRNIGGD